MSNFDLRATFRTIASERDEWDLDSLIDRVIKETPRASLLLAYRTALREYVRVELANLPDSQPGHGRTGTHVQSAGLEQTPNVIRSRSALARAGFRQQVHVGPGAWKSIDLCTAAELLYAAAECDRLAELNAATAQRYRDLVKVMQEQGAELVSDVPTEIVEAVFAR